MFKTCSKCKIEKPATTEYFYKEQKGRSGLMSRCRICYNEVASAYRQTPQGILVKRRGNKKYRESPHGKLAREKYKFSVRGKLSNKKSYLKCKFDMTIEQYDRIYLYQNNCCVICKKPLPYDKIDADHDHKTGKFRGLLCRKCNTAIGLFDDSPEILQNAIFYLEQFK